MPAGNSGGGRHPGLGIGFSFWESHFFVGMHPPLFCGDAPPSSFSPGAEKKKSAVLGGEEKEGFGSRLIGSRLSSLAAQVVRTLCSLVPSRYAGFLLAALRAGAGLGSCVVRSVFFCCASIA